MKHQAHCLKGVGPRWAQIGRHLDSPVHKHTEVKARATIGSLQIVSSDESVKETSNQNAHSVASDGNSEAR